ncbi:hypothetical protein B0H65DRAFT_429446 [Neurospora tetraspora]|uniref:DUF7924 domain-containing protein n=1 Tax=Neurospora tetraspora TaxID=94610 RepID=A0AAE0JEC2_9PEZI|nr:hypothetical protein B0H65DRAFT_429446 [Neurospora tetraspora]
MTLAVRAIVELFRIVKREDEVHRQILTFSVSHDHHVATSKNTPEPAKGFYQDCLIFYADDEETIMMPQDEEIFRSSRILKS